MQKTKKTKMHLNIMTQLFHTVSDCYHALATSVLGAAEAAGYRPHGQRQLKCNVLNKITVLKLLCTS